MLTSDIERYIALRRTLGYTLREGARFLRAFARFATTHGDTHVHAATAVAWAETGSSPYARHIRLRHVVQLARFLHAEDAAHEVPAISIFRNPFVRPLPYIYTPEEIARLVQTAGRLQVSYRYRFRRAVYATLVGLIASTGLRVSEALDLRFQDMLPGGVLHIRQGKFGKSRLVPLHATVREALERYLTARRVLAVPDDDHVFVSASGRRISASTVNYTFHRIVKLARIAPDRPRSPRIHDLRHHADSRLMPNLGRCRFSRSLWFDGTCASFKESA